MTSLRCIIEASVPFECATSDPHCGGPIEARMITVFLFPETAAKCEPEEKEQKISVPVPHEVYCVPGGGDDAYADMPPLDDG